MDIVADHKRLNRHQPAEDAIKEPIDKKPVSIRSRQQLRRLYFIARAWADSGPVLKKWGAEGRSPGWRRFDRAPPIRWTGKTSGKR